jgi:hypothetical protein
MTKRIALLASAALVGCFISISAQAEQTKTPQPQSKPPMYGVTHQSQPTPERYLNPPSSAYKPPPAYNQYRGPNPHP